MCTDQKQADFMIEWRCFLKILHIIGRKKAEITNHSLYDLHRNIIQRLNQDDAQNGLAIAIKKEDDVIVEFLIAEIKYYNQQYAQTGDESTQSPDEEIEDALKDGEIVKTSVEDIVSLLPKWIKKLLKILNEVLKLLSGN